MERGSSGVRARFFARYTPVRFPRSSLSAFYFSIRPAAQRQTLLLLTASALPVSADNAMGCSRIPPFYESSALSLRTSLLRKNASPANSATFVPIPAKKSYRANFGSVIDSLSRKRISRPRRPCRFEDVVRNCHASKSSYPRRHAPIVSPLRSPSRNFPIREAFGLPLSARDFSVSRKGRFVVTGPLAIPSYPLCEMSRTSCPIATCSIA